jgi:hypothetical protein
VSEPGTTPDGERPVIVTAADRRFARCLHQLLMSARRHGLDRACRFVAYDLGIDAATRQRLERAFPWCAFLSFDFAAWPAHARVETGSYAWKPIALWQVVEHAKGPVLWCDSATIFKGPLDIVFATARANGVYSLGGQAPMQERCEPAVMRRLALPRRLWGTRERIGGFLCVDAGNPAARGLAKAWRDLALEKDLLLPPVRTVARHMNDQAVLSCLLLKAEDDGLIRLTGDEADISSAQPVRFVSTRNKVGSSVPLWADPVVRVRYALEKGLDQFWLRLDRSDTPVHALYKWRGEFFEVRYRGPDGVERVVPTPAGHYYADPFVWRQDGRTWLLVEDFAYRRHRATLAAIPLDGALSAGRAVPVLDPGVHASFPFVFRHAGTTWMVPETGRAGGIDLYACGEFPHRWRRARRLVDGVDAVDSAVFSHGGRWWLTTSLASPRPGGPNRYLAVFHTDDPVTGEWRPHPVNEAALYIEAARGTGRNAGAIVVRDGRIFRPMQKSSAFYGEGMAMMEIVDLSPTTYREEPARPPFPLEDIAGRFGVHHATETEGVIAWDVRLRY